MNENNQKFNNSFDVFYSNSAAVPMNMNVNQNNFNGNFYGNYENNLPHNRSLDYAMKNKKNKFSSFNTNPILNNSDDFYNNSRGQNIFQRNDRPLEYQNISMGQYCNNNTITNEVKAENPINQFNYKINGNLYMFSENQINQSAHNFNSKNFDNGRASNVNNYCWNIINYPSSDGEYYSKFSNRNMQGGINNSNNVLNNHNSFYSNSSFRSRDENNCSDFNSNSNIQDFSSNLNLMNKNSPIKQFINDIDSPRSPHGVSINNNYYKPFNNFSKFAKGNINVNSMNNFPNYVNDSTNPHYNYLQNNNKNFKHSLFIRNKEVENCQNNLFTEIYNNSHCSVSNNNKSINSSNNNIIGDVININVKTTMNNDSLNSSSNKLNNYKHSNKKKLKTNKQNNCINNSGSKKNTDNNISQNYSSNNANPNNEDYKNNINNNINASNSAENDIINHIKFLNCDISLYICSQKGSR